MQGTSRLRPSVFARRACAGDARRPSAARSTRSSTSIPPRSSDRLAKRRSSHMRRGSVTAPEPDRNNATTSSSNDVMKANSAPTSTPGRISGSVTWRNVPHGVAPRLRAACSSRRSKPARLAPTLVTTNGHGEAGVRRSPGQVACRQDRSARRRNRCRSRQRSPARSVAIRSVRRRCCAIARGRRARPSAASVPSTVASTTTAAATVRLSRSPRAIRCCRDRRCTSGHRTRAAGTSGRSPRRTTGRR